MKKKKLITTLLLLLFFIGLFVLFYPSISSFWNQKTQSRVISDFESSVSELSDDSAQKLFEEAEAYNRALQSLGFALADFDQLDGYESLLNPNGNGMMGYVEIDKIQVYLPLFHGTDSSVLNVACGHIEGSSMPIGGIGTHCIISAHRGLPTAKLFTNLDKLEIGDTFHIYVLNRDMVYQVDRIKTVTPDDVTDLLIDPEQDYCTLLTCTPYGVNSHRLLVRGVRVESETKVRTVVTSDAFMIDRLIVTPAVAMPIILLLVIYVWVKPTKKKLPVTESIEQNEGDSVL